MRLIFGSIVVAACALLLAACASSGTGKDGREKTLAEEVAETIERFKTRDMSMKKFFETARGYAVFPTVAKGGFGVGGAHGEGHVFENGEFVGTAELTQATIGLQVGGQTYSEIVFFKDQEALDRFKDDSFEFSGQASAVAVRSGASADADYESGVAVFTMTKAGLMLEASIGGQQFTFQEKR